MPQYLWGAILRAFEVKFVGYSFLVNNTGFHLNQKPEPSTPFLGPPDQPARPRTMPGPRARPLPTRRMGPTRQNGRWGFGALSRSRSRSKVTLEHPSVTSTTDFKIGHLGLPPAQRLPLSPHSVPGEQAGPKPNPSPSEALQAIFGT